MSEDQGKAGEPLPATVKPPFDLEQFARETDTKLVLEGSPASGRPTAPPPPAVRREEAGSDVPVVAISREDLEWFELSPDARDLMHQVNGRDTVESLSGLLHLPMERLRVDLEALAREGLITWR